MPQEEIKLKAFETVLEWSKQFVTISSGTLVLSAIFIKDIAGGQVSSPNLLIITWGCLLASVLAGIVVMGALSSYLNKGSVSQLNVYSRTIRISALVQVITFFAGIVLFLAYVVQSLG